MKWWNRSTAVLGVRWNRSRSIGGTLGVGYLITAVALVPVSAQEAGSPAPEALPIDSAAAVAGSSELTVDIDSTADSSTSTAAAPNAGDTVNPEKRSIGVAINGNDGSTVSATANVTGFPTIENGNWGNIEWKVDGPNVIGMVHNRDGTIEGTFEGTVTAAGLTGKFTHHDGRVGDWSWNGPPPAGAAGDASADSASEQ